MSRVHKAIDAAVRQAEEDEANSVRRHEGLAVAKFLQGQLAGLALSHRLDIKIADVTVPIDAQGDYEDHFVVTTEAGHRIRVSVELL